MTPLAPPARLLAFLTDYPRYIIAGHKEPDGDCVGSQLALASVLQRLGKTAICCSAGPFKRTEIAATAPLFQNEPTEDQLRDAAVVLVDCSRAERAGGLAPLLGGLPLALIDHHVDEGAPADPSYIDSGAPSATFMVEALITALGLTATRYEAEWLFFGLSTDTGFFRHVDADGAPTFDCAARLIRCGADPRACFQAINGGKSLESRILMGLILARTTAHHGGKLLVSYETLEDTERFGLQGRDSDAIYQMLQAVASVEAVALVRQEKPDNCTAGLRSRGEVRVDRVAARFGGGGHRQASGLSVGGRLETVIPALIEAFADEFCKRM